ncbi:Asr1405/Asl0597 family protein [Gloeothece verrucosa]|uniref:Uncharacterized protein n=1 Tax=Gloeothece verrucosa (strain PCC 7822) TaxID=497965 RepID=E0UBQ9_GLOV7|nr:Asr1405/Asl0597 family protein [Gloeothece verrucosa]ADN14003.1 conserved hypothetical protein [Gloeothece verrucosa PCC 7822]
MFTPLNQTHLSPQTKVLIDVPPQINSRIFKRLQSLAISCGWTPEGKFWVRVDNAYAAIQLQSVLHQFLAPREMLENWLIQCWQLNS